MELHEQLSIKEEKLVNCQVLIQELNEKLKASPKKQIIETVIKKEKKKKKKSRSSSSDEREEFSQTMISKTDTNVLTQIRTEHRNELEEKEKEIMLLNVTIEELYAEIETVRSAS